MSEYVIENGYLYKVGDATWSRRRRRFIARIRSRAKQFLSFLKSAEFGKQVLCLLIGINVAVFSAWHGVGGVSSKFMWQNFSSSRTSLMGPARRWWTLLTYGVSHYDTVHLVSNLVGLWTFGLAISDLSGGAALLACYTLGCAAGGIAHTCLTPFVPTKFLGFITYMGESRVIGASGAIMALCSYLTVLVPHSRVQTTFCSLPLWLFTASYALYSAFHVIGPPSASEAVSHAAHLGGVVMGAILGAITII